MSRMPAPAQPQQESGAGARLCQMTQLPGGVMSRMPAPAQPQPQPQQESGAGARLGQMAGQAQLPGNRSEDAAESRANFEAQPAINMSGEQLRAQGYGQNNVMSHIGGSINSIMQGLQPPQPQPAAPSQPPQSPASAPVGKASVQPAAGGKSSIMGKISSILDGIPGGLAGGSLATLAAGMQPKETDKLKNDAYGALTDPAHESRLRKIRVQAQLHDLLANDDYLSGEDPRVVTGLHNELSQIAPRAAESPMLMRSLLKRYLSQGGTDPHELAQLTDIEKGLKMRDRPEASGDPEGSD